MSDTDFTCVVNVVLYSFSEATNNYDEYGPVSCAVIGRKETTTCTYKLGCYRDNKYICTADIKPNNDTGAHIARDAAYVTFRDDASHYWSLQFSTEDGAIEFCAQVVVAMFGAAGEPQDNILACDIAQGKESKQVFVGDLVKAFYRVWVVQCSELKGELPKLGSLLEKECEDAVKFAAPANHQGVTASMRGFEGMSVGMREGGQRLVVIPLKAKRGRGPNVPMCFYIEVSRRKDQRATTKASAGRPTRGGNEDLAAAGIVGTNNAAGGSSQLLAITGGPAEPSATAAANGLSKDQFLLVDRLRDQVFTLNEQLRDARREVDNMSSDLKRQRRQSSKQSLTSAQIEYSIEQLLASSESKKSILEDKKVLIGEAEARNRELESRLSKFLQTIKTLGDEVQAAADESAGERIELDRQLADTQAKVVRLGSEIDDANRHLQALKNMARANEIQLKEEKTHLTMSLNDHQVNTEKLHTLQENYGDESAQRKLLESKLLTLQEELRRTQDDAQLKETLTQQTRAKMENDTTHYSQLIQQEREQAAIELRQLKQDLIEELTARGRQYEEAKQRIAVEAYEQGMAQGVEEGLTDAANEGDVIAHDMAVNAQKCKAEVAALQVRLQSNKAANEADERQLRSQLESVQNSLARVLQESNALASQLEVAQSEHAIKEEELYQRLTRFIHSCGPAPISQPCLAAMMRAAETGGDFDPYSFQQMESSKETQQAREERSAVSAWVRASVYNQPTRMPPLRPPFPCNASSKGPMLSAETMGTKMRLSSGADRRMALAASWSTSTPPLPSTHAKTKFTAKSDAAAPTSPPAESAPDVAAPYPDIPFRSPAASPWDPQGAAPLTTSASNSRVHFPSPKIRYHHNLSEETASEPPEDPSS
ncbi:hypothetical protein ABB37_03073 [Leptomonas pyrrhocoris]|uniref:Uncharacterized protein n=1 Tax=Leptomonas pyrrhocoris TaxID=157538 RepID=A0A0N0DXW1_LEPPY|nr:hypothetical protein ABB37_03073 [Leptomonas pyrrhocoris]KPA83445.1 hypothetical protein ABB37_03073 [Leptomonas pyrrhocoris]|eukprot:XP_015661884.1 hypothetical protein ABB37_03073 [Leptomonas pyrrhocoris]